MQAWRTPKTGYGITRMVRPFLTIILFLGILLTPAHAQVDQAELEQQFRQWLEEILRPKAEAQSISQEIFDKAFNGVTLDFDIPGIILPGMEEAPAADQQQAEFRAPVRYFNQKRLKGTAAIGRKIATRYAKSLNNVEQVTGVPGRVILAIWARESGFGRVAIPHNVFRILGTRAFASTGEYLTNELIAALEIAQDGHVPIATLKSSWAGALGQPQFMPASYLAYAVDGDGDGRADIWGSDVDSIASIANFLLVHGWLPGQDWGYEVEVPAAVSCSIEGPENKRPLAQWLEMGIKRSSGKAFPDVLQQVDSSLLMPAGRGGPTFLVTPNFYVLKRYNRSDLYALYVGNLADRIEFDSGDFLGDWGPVSRMRRSDIATIQQALELLGYDVGGADGLPGYKTRRAIGLWQETKDQPATCFPDPGIKAALAE